ncbi:hypothetical protein [Acidiphilium sp. 34-64-41]|uniref:hypothetical protein n=1 Tax=Acidiphilium sp. 34-64-41 TaxID=1970297 RepID=UPI00257D015C|nr:hypothetical protein [Acidiphilium sp. 34-64-41]
MDDTAARDRRINRKIGDCTCGSMRSTSPARSNSHGLVEAPLEKRPRIQAWTSWIVDEEESSLFASFEHGVVGIPKEAAQFVVLEVVLGVYHWVQTGRTGRRLSGVLMLLSVLPLRLISVHPAGINREK